MNQSTVNTPLSQAFQKLGPLFCQPKLLPSLITKTWYSAAANNTELTKTINQDEGNCTKELYIKISINCVSVCFCEIYTWGKVLLRKGKAEVLFPCPIYSVEWDIKWYSVSSFLSLSLSLSLAFRQKIIMSPSFSSTRYNIKLYTLA